MKSRWTDSALLNMERRNRKKTSPHTKTFLYSIFPKDE